jgi:hypothetical protein
MIIVASSGPLNPSKRFEGRKPSGTTIVSGVPSTLLRASPELMGAGPSDVAPLALAAVGGERLVVWPDRLGRAHPANEIASPASAKYFPRPSICVPTTT